MLTTVTLSVIWKERKRHAGDPTQQVPLFFLLREETMKTILDLQQASRLLQLSDRTVRDLSRAGQMPGATKVGRKWRFHRDTLIAHVAGRKVEDEASPRPSEAA